MGENRNEPLVVELPVSAEGVTPETAPPVPDADRSAGQSSTAFQATTLMFASRPGRALRWAIGFFSAFVVMTACLAIWEFLAGLILRFPVLGWLAVLLLVCASIAALYVAVKEILALRRLTRLDQLQQRALNARTLTHCLRPRLSVLSLKRSTVAGRSCVGRRHGLQSKNKKYLMLMQ